MITLAWYLLKVIICSGILCSYYFLALRNKVFHRWNRFYLLAAIIISLSAPIMKIDIFRNSDKGTVVQMLQTISYGDEVVVEYSRNNGFQINTQNLAEGAYLLISVIFLLIFFVSLYKIKRMKKKYPATKIEDISFISTNAKGTPFSFFKSIFWNNAIDLHSKPGQQIFNHEIAHVKEKHSYDKIFMNLVLIFFWINPFFWLMRKELYMIHEFVADKEALEDSDINAFAEMILQTVYPGQNFSVTNKFFYSPIKRRILMLTKNKNPKVSYVSRLLVLPLAAIVFFAFTLKVKSKNNLNSYDGKQITVVIDAGHGGADNGAHSSNGLKEKDITLSIAKKIAALNSNEHINILLSRNNDQSISVRDRVHFAKKNDADLFVSIHVNGAVDEQLNGFSVLIDKNNTEKNKLLASALIDELKANYKTDSIIKIRNKGLVVIDSNSCPAAVVECGYMTNSNDVAFISKDPNQEKIAKNILTAINNYASSLTDHVSEVVINALKSTKYVNNQKKVEVTYYDNSKEIITKEEALKRGFIPPPPPPARIYNGKKVRSAEGISNQKIIIHFLDGTKETITREDAKKAGFILFTPPKIVKDSIPKKVYQKVEVEASFPGGPSAWQKYIVRKIQASLDSFTNTDYGTCVIRFIVDVDGRVSDVQATTMKGTLLAKISVDAIKSGPKWTPASQNGHYVNSYRLQPVTLTNPDNKKRIQLNLVNPSDSTSFKTTNEKKEILLKLQEQKAFLKLREPASFPGGQSSWLKYISHVIDKNGNELMSDKNNLGTCRIAFMVSEDGKVINVQAVTMKGTQLADVAVNAIEKGPKWNPAKENGHFVNSYVMVPVTFKLNDKLMINEPQ